MKCLNCKEIMKVSGSKDYYTCDICCMNYISINRHYRFKYKINDDICYDLFGNFASKTYLYLNDDLLYINNFLNLKSSDEAFDFINKFIKLRSFT